MLGFNRHGGIERPPAADDRPQAEEQIVESMIAAAARADGEEVGLIIHDPEGSLVYGYDREEAADRAAKILRETLAAEGLDITPDQPLS